ncbi:hypothetical protein B296_00051186 [Ensete ventricosum]|uniref:Uncharacterized protein n=1 Tax=Ensete ventricosum TaxID=4639 RepID=A0A426YHU2_ENSVE|nr:hypothetical protein B296_00051186 [Ensete ventricosum]
MDLGCLWMPSRWDFDFYFMVMAEALAKKCPAEEITVATTEKSIATWPERHPTEGGNERSSKKRKCMARKGGKGVAS